ncbi:MAG: GTP-dependent dephospho-CoA kinase family protein [Candidatus Nitrosocosmicus sp.]
MKVNPEKLDLLKEPFGILIKDNLVNKKNVTQILGNASKIVTVGDTTTEKLLGFGIIPDISVIDGKEKRVIKTTKLDYEVDRVLKLNNNPGELDEKIISEVRKLVFQTEVEADGNNSEDEENKSKVAIVTEGAAERFEEKEKEEEKDASKTAETTLISLKTASKKTDSSDLSVSQTKRISSDVKFHDLDEFAATSSEKVQIVIEGEEDIVALPFLIFAPVGWVVCYGQPNEGLVIVKITEESKKRAESIFNKVFL